MRGQLLVDPRQRAASTHRQHLVHADPLQVVEVIIGMRHGGATDDDAVVAQEGHVLALHRPRDALAFGPVQRQAVVVGIDADAAMKAHRALA
jgi:hypothetical protein